MSWFIFSCFFFLYPCILTLHLNILTLHCQMFICCLRKNKTAKAPTSVFEWKHLLWCIVCISLVMYIVPYLHHLAISKQALTEYRAQIVAVISFISSCMQMSVWFCSCKCEFQLTANFNWRLAAYLWPGHVFLAENKLWISK